LKVKVAIGTQPSGKYDVAANAYAVVTFRFPVFLILTTHEPAPVDVATSFMFSICTLGLFAAAPDRLKKTPETTTAAATVIAISSITATSGLKPADVFLLISTKSLHFFY
jgi:hypothetical protein